ncbi:MFS transporter [Rickenella mellea]|uniref:MFS transporter n=1 Tax=Rickenella mellea TaxID=50990 RepID=A0A4V3AZH4_9AGAM|nr:MFS transporter [Rickenella mellea]
MSDDKFDQQRLESTKSIDSRTKRPFSTGSEETNEKHVPVSVSFGDAAQAILGENTHQPMMVTAEENSRVLRKIDKWLLPIMLGVYFLQQLDKSTLSYASVFNLQTDAHLHGYEFSALGSIVYIAQLIWQPVSSFFLVRLPVGRWLAFNVLMWGIVLSCMTSALDFPRLLTARFFLGIFEATVAPTFVTITAMWWRRREQTQRTSFWYAMNGVTTIFGSLMSYGLGHIKSPHLKPYQIIFLFTGLLTVVFSLFVFLIMPDSPTTARFLTTPQKIIAVERLRANNMGTETKVWKWRQVKECLLDPKTYCWFLMAFLISIPSGGISTFGPLITKSFGFDQLSTILLQMPFGAVQVLATVGAGYAATRFKLKSPILVFLTLPPIAGAAALLHIPRGPTHRGGLLAAYYIISFYPAISPLIYTWSSQNTSGHSKKTLTTGILFIGQSAGNIVGPFLYTTAEAPLYHRGLTSSMACFAALCAVVGATAAYLAFLNRQQSKRREALGKSGSYIDTSLETREDAEKMQGQNGSRFGEKAFDDLTDRQNEDFIYVL